jgi:steroid delta-isomerase-like uncharacterized protein
MATDVERVYKDYLAAFNSHDVAKIAALWTDDALWEDVASGQVARSKRELIASFSDIFAAVPNVTCELKFFFSAGNRIGAEWVETGTQTGDWAGIPATGKSYLIRGASITEVYNGKITRETSYFNMLDFLQQLGLMPKTSSE